MNDFKKSGMRRAGGKFSEIKDQKAQRPQEGVQLVGKVLKGQPGKRETSRAVGQLGSSQIM